MADLRDLLRSRAVILGGVLSHKYLKNRFILPSERAAAGMIRERPAILGEIEDAVRDYLDEFLEGYDPSAFVAGVDALQRLNDSVRCALVATVDREYHRRFRPLERVEQLRCASDEFASALAQWHECVSSDGLGQQSALLWITLQARAAALHDLLTDPALATRWIP